MFVIGEVVTPRSRGTVANTASTTFLSLLTLRESLIIVMPETLKEDEEERNKQTNKNMTAVRE